MKEKRISVLINKWSLQVVKHIFATNKKRNHYPFPDRRKEDKK